ncbi:hypothetical protein D3C87_1791480 [compost metagenome]
MHADLTFFRYQVCGKAFRHESILRLDRRSILEVAQHCNQALSKELLQGIFCDDRYERESNLFDRIRNLTKNHGKELHVQSRSIYQKHCFYHRRDRRTRQENDATEKQQRAQYR